MVWLSANVHDGCAPVDRRRSARIERGGVRKLLQTEYAARRRAHMFARTQTRTRVSRSACRQRRRSI
jgi:hypothetical protein